MCALALSGCVATKTSTEQVKELKSEHYSLTEPEREALSTEWRQAGNEVVGEVRVASCRIERHWESAEMQVKRREPNMTAAYVFQGVGVGLLSFSTSLAYLTGEDAYYAGAGVGVLAVIVGLATTAQKKSVEYERTNVQKQTTNEVGACIRRLDSPSLGLALKLPNGKGLPVKLRGDGRATIAIPQGYSVPTGVDLLIVVHRRPDSASEILRHGQVVGMIRLEPSVLR